MQQGRFLFSAITSALVLFANTTPAAPPAPFGSWTTSTKGISATCPTGFSCDVSATDKDMTQQVLYSRDGKRYVQTIVDSTDIDKTRLQSESFVNASNSALAGISAKQVVTTPGSQSLTTSVILNTGWADDAASPTIKIEQTQKDSTYKGVGYGSRFIYEGNIDSNGKTTGYYLDIRQEVSNSSKASSGITPSGQDLHVFVTRKAGGDRVTASSASLPASAGGMGGMMGSGGPSGGSVSWKNGNEVQVIWIGQRCQGCFSGGGMGGGMMMGSGDSFSYQAYDNLSDSAAAVASRTFTTSPINWKNPPFGTQPTFGKELAP